MTPRERLLAVYRGETPDQVPCMLDLSHWFYHHEQRPWDLGQTYPEPEHELIALHRHHGMGFYLPNLGAFTSARYSDDVRGTTTRQAGANGEPELVWRLETPLGTISRARRWEPATYAWGITQWGVRTTADLRVLAYALSRRVYTGHWERVLAWQAAVGDLGVLYISGGYSAMGHLLNYWMGAEGTLFAAVDEPDALADAVAAINANNLAFIDLLAQSPAEVILLGDNMSSDLQPPAFFARWSRDYYVEAIQRLHAAGKYVAVHIDGRLRGAIAMIRDTGADAGDAITPAPLGDLTAAQCRAEAGDRFILSGGVSPDLWLPNASLARFDAAAEAWLAQKATTSRFVLNAGDQVPPGAEESRIGRLRDLAASQGRY